MLWKFKIIFLVKFVLLVKSKWLLKKKSDPHHTVKGTTDNILSMGENQAYFEPVPTAIMGTATVHGEPITLLCTPNIPLLVLKLWYRNSPTDVSVCALPCQPFVHFIFL
jgi:hypothetical protein